MHKFQEFLNQSIRHLQIADHMTYVTYPLINDKRLLLKIIEEIHLSIFNSIISALKFECENKENIKLFFKKYSKNYNIKEKDILKIKEILEISNRHKESAMEFVRNEKVVIMSNNLGTKIIDIQQVKSYLLAAKELLLKVNQRIDKRLDNY